MTVLPFICLGIGILLGIFVTVPKFAEIAEKVSTIALVFLMLAIGLGIGLDKNIVGQFGVIGFNCLVIALSAITFSVILVVICEKTVLPLGTIEAKLSQKNLSIEDSSGKAALEEKKTSHLVWIMPGSIVVGLISGIGFRPYLEQEIVDLSLTISLIILYICVGVSQGTNREVFRFIKVLGFKIVWLSIAIILGSLLGGLLSGMILGLPLHVSMVSAGGMSFYSLTGAFMTQTYGLEIGTYGFIVNVMREFFTVLLMPVLIKISKGSPIAGGAAGNMDTMLAPVTKFVGVRLGLVALITGTVLTFVVPFLLPILAGFFQTSMV